jgi:hypothetical protein
MHNKKRLLPWIMKTENIASHAFYPLIHTTISNKKYKRPDEQTFKFNNEYKNREIYYAAHIDAQVYSYYASLLSEFYEKRLTEIAGLTDCITAYRRIPSTETNRNKCSIDFSHDIFKFLKAKCHSEKCILTFDITGFFDSLDHGILKKRWYSLLNKTSLPQDHYNIYKTVINFSYVEIDDLLKEFGHKKQIHLKWNDVQAFCVNATEFRKRVREKGLIRSNKKELNEKKQLIKRTKGIAQGTPISSILSNIYLLEFDKEVHSFVKQFEDTLYRRYSDDIFIICDKKNVEMIQKLLVNKINEAKLTINQKKSEAFLIKQKNNSEFSIYKCKDPANPKWEAETLLEYFYKENQFPIQYLGFEFFGKEVHIRSLSLSKYYKTMKKDVRRRAVYAFYAKLRKEKTGNENINSSIYKTSLYRRHSHHGQLIKRICKLNKKGEKVISKYWGNYLSYAKKADEIMGSDCCYRQLRNHLDILRDKIAYYEKKCGLPENFIPPI